MTTRRTYNNIIDRLQAFATGHYLIGRFTQGNIAQIDDYTTESVYPLMHVEPTDFNPEPGQLTYNFSITFADLPRDKENPADNRREIISDTMQIALDLIAEIRNGNVLFGSDVDLVTTPTITPFIDEFANFLTGVTLQISIIVPYNWDACDIPADYAVGGSGSGGSGGTGGGVLLKVNGVNNTVQTILNLIEGDNMTITDNGDGSVTFDASGGGGGGGGIESVTGLNTDNADPDNPIVRISVDGTTITGSGTPASPLVAAPQTLQSVLDTGSTLNKSNSIDAATFDFAIVNVGKLGFSGSGNQTFQRTAGGNSQALTLNGTVASMFYITGTSERGFAAGSGSVMIITTKIKNSTAVARQPLLLTNATTGDVEFDSLTTADVNDSANRRYVTDAQQTVIGNTSGTNTGDQDLSSLMVKASNLSDLTNTTTARTNLGLGTLATQSGTFSGTSSGTNTGDETASTIKTKLGTTTVGENLNILANPSAVRFLRINADNTVSALSAADMRTALNIIDTITLSGGNVGGTIGAGVTTYVSPTIDAVPSTTETNRASIVSVAGTLRGFYYSSLSTQPATGSFVLTLRKATGMGSFSSTALTITVAAGAVAGIFSDTTNTVSVAAGDRLSIQLVNNATGASHSIGTWQMIIERTL